MIGVGDPVRAGLVASLARPGGNITGNTVLSPDLGPKRLQTLREVIANAGRVVYLANPDNASNMAALAETKIAASEAGMVLIAVEVRAVDDFEPAFAAIMRERPDAILVSNDPFHQLHIRRIIEFLTQNRLPGMFQSKEGVVAGGFIGYGPNLSDLFRRAAGYVHRILQGHPASRSAGGAADEVRSRGEPRVQVPSRFSGADLHRPRRRGDRMKMRS
jgi:putative tryptophan/tyrosine transport system substrate-binding protein